MIVSFELSVSYGSLGRFSSDSMKMSSKSNITGLMPREDVIPFFFSKKGDCSND